MMTLRSCAIFLLILLVCVLFGCSATQGHSYSDDPELIPFAIGSYDKILFIDTHGRKVHRVTDEYTVAYALNSRYFYALRTGQDPLEYVLYAADGQVLATLGHPPIAISEREVAVCLEDLSPELIDAGVIGLPYKAMDSQTGWIESAGLLFVRLIEGDWVVLDVEDGYKEIKRFDGVGVSWRMSDQLVLMNDRDGFSWVVGHDLTPVSPKDLDVRSGPTGSHYTGQDRSESLVRMQVYRMDEMLFDLPNDFVNAYVFASGITWAETSDGYGCVFSPSGEVVERRDGWSIQQSTTPCRYALFEIEGEEGLFVVDENIEIIARYPGVAGHVSITEDGYVCVNNSDERYRVFDRTGALIWEDATPSP